MVDRFVLRQWCWAAAGAVLLAIVSGVVRSGETGAPLAVLEAVSVLGGLLFFADIGISSFNSGRLERPRGAWFFPRRALIGAVTYGTGGIAGLSFSAAINPEVSIDGGEWWVVILMSLFSGALFATIFSWVLTLFLTWQKRRLKKLWRR